MCTHIPPLIGQGLHAPPHPFTSSLAPSPLLPPFCPNPLLPRCPPPRSPRQREERIIGPIPDPHSFRPLLSIGTAPWHLPPGPRPPPGRGHATDAPDHPGGQTGEAARVVMRMMRMRMRMRVMMRMMMMMMMGRRWTKHSHY